MNPLKFYHPDALEDVTPFNPLSVNHVDLDDENKEFCALVFKPDPLTLNPTSIVDFMMSGADEGFKNYVRQRLMSAVPVGALADTAEESEKLVKPNIMTSEQFYRYARDYVLSLSDVSNQ